MGSLYNTHGVKTTCYIFVEKLQGILDRTYKAYFTTADTSSPANLVLLMLYLGNVSL
jgi:hypothetical protein